MTLIADKVKQELSAAKEAFKATEAKLEKKIEDLRASISNLEQVATPSLIRSLEAELEHAKAELIKLKEDI